MVPGQKEREKTGKVYIVGAGPGDPGLISVRGRECLAMADAVVYDHLIHPELLSVCAKAEKIYVGKRTKKHSLPQDEINNLLIDLAQHYRVIVRLKGGDPFIFGRGGEEALALENAGITWEVVPGITSGSAVPAYAGIPLTHRGLSATAVFTTVHDEASLDRLDIQLKGWTADTTVVCFMAARRTHSVAEVMLARGVPPSLPVACIRWGTWGIQETLVCDLSELRDIPPDSVQAPALLVIGRTVSLREKLNWFEQRPLHGIKIVLTHTENRVGPLEKRLRDLGAELFLLPVFQLEPIPDSRESVDLNRYDWLLLTSVNAVHFLLETLENHKKDLRSFPKLRIAAVGESTRQALNAAHIYPDVAPDGYDGKEICRLMLEKSSAIARDKIKVLLPCSDISRSSIVGTLREIGMAVTELVSYRVVDMSADDDRLSALMAFAPHLVLFTNAKAVRAFHALVGKNFCQTCPETVFGVLGPITGAAARDCGYTPKIEPAQHTVDALVDAVVRHFKKG